MKKKSILLRISVALLALTLLLSGCGGSSAPAADSGESQTAGAPAEEAAQSAAADGLKVFRFGQAPYGDTLDMQISTGSLSASIADEITESMLRFDDDNNEEVVLLTDAAYRFPHRQRGRHCVQLRAEAGREVHQRHRAHRQRREVHL